METIVAGTLLCIVMIVAAVCCMPPFLQAKEYNDKPAMFFSIFCFLLMIGLIIAMITKMVGAS